MSQGSTEGPPQQPWCSSWPPRRVPPDKPADTADPPETMLLPGGLGRGRTIAISVGAWRSWGSPLPAQGSQEGSHGIYILLFQ